MEGFEEFWTAYPKKVSKGDAKKAWMQTASIRPELADLLAAVERGKSSVQWHRADREGNIGAFIPYPATYLRQEGWDNEYTIRLSAIKTQEVARPEPITKPTEEQVQKAREALSKVGLRRVA